MVRDKANGANTPAYLVQTGRPPSLLFDTGLGDRADFEVVTPRLSLADFKPARLWLPYGYWTLQDGSEVIFAQDYLPLWRISHGSVERLDPWLWINGVASEFHFARSIETVVWAKGPVRELALQHLVQHRIFELPKLVNVMPYLFGADVSSIEDGVRRLRELGGANTAPPSYTELSRRLLYV